MFTRNMINNRGFTLIELMVVVAIVAIVMAIAFPSYERYVVTTKRAVAQNALLQVADRQQQFFMDNKQFAASLANLGFAANPWVVDDQGSSTVAGDAGAVYSVTLTNVTVVDNDLVLPFSTNVGDIAVGGSVTVSVVRAVTADLTNTVTATGYDPNGDPVADNDDAVVDLINSRGFANAACIYTASGAAAREFKYRVKPAMIGVNIGIAAPMSFFPFGGSGNSMFGDIKGHGQEIFQFFTDTKVVIERWF